MTRTGKKRFSIHVAVPQPVRAALDKIASERTQEGKTVYASDIVREAIQEYLERRGISISVDVDRGGYRGSDKEDR